MIFIYKYYKKLKPTNILLIVLRNKVLGYILCTFS
jgi:hypothetical protein